MSFDLGHTLTQPDCFTCWLLAEPCSSHNYSTQIIKIIENYVIGSMRPGIKISNSLSLNRFSEQQRCQQTFITRETSTQTISIACFRSRFHVLTFWAGIGRGSRFREGILMVATHFTTFCSIRQRPECTSMCHRRHQSVLASRPNNNYSKLVVRRDTRFQAAAEHDGRVNNGKTICFDGAAALGRSSIALTLIPSNLLHYYHSILRQTSCWLARNRTQYVRTGVQLRKTACCLAYIRNAPFATFNFLVVWPISILFAILAAVRALSGRLDGFDHYFKYLCNKSLAVREMASCISKQHCHWPNAGAYAWFSFVCSAVVQPALQHFS